MKKVFFLLLALVFVLSIPYVAFAEDTLLNYRWVDVQNTVKQVFGSSGTFYPIDEVNATIWLPDEFVSVDPSEADLNDSCIGFYLMGDNAFVLINYIDSDGLDLDSYYNQCIQQGTSIEKVLINDIPALEQDTPANNSFLLMFQTQENKFLQFIFSPLSNPVNGIIMSSIQSTVPEESAPAVEPEPAEVSETPAPVNPVSGLISK